MPNKRNHRRFGSIRKLPSGRYQIRYPGPDGLTRTGRETYERKGDAERALVNVEADMSRGDWIDPARAKVTVSAYAELWIAQRPGLRPRTVQLYRWTLKRHIAPGLGGVPLGQLTTPMIREWRAGLLAQGVSTTMAAKAYRLLRAVLWTAVKEDQILNRNPCRIPGADKENPDERPTLTLAEVRRLAAAVPDRYSMMILTAAITSMRYGEITALMRRHVDLKAGTIRVQQQYVEVRGSGLILGPPKSRAGIRTLAIPPALVELLRAHLDEYVGPEPDALVFCGPSGRPIRRGNFNKLVKWTDNVASIGRPGFHFHDLRHTGNHLAAASKVSTRDLMARMGHDSMAAALIYQHASQEANKAITDHLNEALSRDDDDDDGAAGALVAAG